MDHTTRYRQARSFGPAAGLYDLVRPRYPVKALRWILGDLPVDVVDLGAGTGILSRQLTGLAYRVTPVEPDPQMRSKLLDADGSLGPLAGSAEAIPLPDASVDAVVAGQAYHWFDRSTAHPEIARVLKPHGVFGPLWNDRDEEVAWVAALSAIIAGHRAATSAATDTADATGRADATGTTGRADTAGTTGRADTADTAVSARPELTGSDLGRWFTPVERAAFRHAVTHTPDTLVELMRSRSYYLTAAPAGRHAMDTAIRELCATHPDLTGRAEFELPYVTRAYRAHRLPMP
jgi:SAM-dependent methyltransferase